MQSYAVADQPRALQLELIDSALEQIGALLVYITTGGKTRAPISVVVLDLDTDLDNAAIDLVKLRTGHDDREINPRLDRVAKFRTDLETLKGAKQ